MNERDTAVIGNIEELVEPELLNRFPFSFLQKNCLLPLKAKTGDVIIATDDPSKIDAGELREILNQDVRIIRAEREKINECLERYYYHPSSSRKVIEDLKGDEEEMENLQEELAGETDNLLDLANKAPVIRLVNQILYRAIASRATDIHLQTTENAFKVRYRIDGMLHDTFVLPRRYQPAIISRVKIVSDLDIAEKRIPQDGRTSIKVDGEQIDIRVSIIPTFFGESAVLRLLNKSAFVYTMEKLGLVGESYELFNKLIRYDHGIILLTGPTGSGKTTTLYSGLARINNPNIHIVTLEDPVEYNLDGINQIAVNPKAGLTFATGLRSILRHDPDIIMVGEIRDRETADMAIQASLTGHLVLSTLHTNDAASAVTRLLDMGIEPFLLASSLIGVMAQRLIRLNCPHCSQPTEVPVASLEEISISADEAAAATLRKGAGCKNCFNTGYFDRTGIFELLFIDEQLRNLIVDRVSAGVIKKAALEHGLKTLRMDGAAKVRQGLTTVGEVLRVTQDI